MSRRCIAALTAHAQAAVWILAAMIAATLWTVVIRERNLLGGTAVATLLLALMAVMISRTLSTQRADQTALRANEARFSALASLGSDWYWETDPDYRFSVMSYGVSPWSGHRFEELLGKARWELEFLEPYGTNWSEHRETVERRLAFQDFRMRCTARDGTVTYLRVDGEPVNAADGEFLGYRGIGRDITQEIRLQQRLRLQHRVSQILVSGASSSAAIASILQAICETVSWQWGARRVLDRRTGDLSCAEWWCEPSLSGSELVRTTCDVTSKGRPGGLIWRTVVTGEPQWWSSAPGEYCTRREQGIRAAGLHAGLSIPIDLGGHVDSVFELFAIRAERPDSMLLETLRAVGREVGQFLKRVAAEEARAQLERERSQLMAAMRLQLESMPMACVVKDRDFRIVFWNSAAERIFGFTREEALGRTPLEVFVPESARQRVEAIRSRLVAGNITVQSVNENITRDGRTIICEWCNTALIDEHGTFLGSMSMAQDVTARLQMEQEVRDSEERYRNLFEQAPLPLLVFEVESLQLMAVNQAAVEKYGYTRDQFLAMTILDLQVPEDREHVARQLRASDATKSAFLQRRHVRGSGEVVLMEVTARPLQYRGRRARLLLLNDVTENQRMEQRLRENEHRLTLALEGSHRALFDWNIETGTVYLSDLWNAMLGGERQETRTSFEALAQLLHEDDAGLVQRSIAAVLRGDKPYYQVEHRVKTHAGEWVWIESQGRVTERTTEGGALRLVGTNADVTQRKNAAEVLRESEARYRMIFVESPVPMWVRDSEFRILDVNAAALQLFGYAREEMLRMTTLELHVPENRDLVVRQWNERVREGRSTPIATDRRRYRTKDGRIVESETTTGPFQYPEQPMLLVVINDITERVKAEAALYESEEQFRQLADNIPQGFWISDVDARQTLYVSPAAAHLIGRPVREIVAHRTALIRAVHREDRARVHAARKLAARGAYDETYRVVRPDGSVRWVQDRAFPVRDTDGRVYRIAGIAEDITARRHADDALRASEELLRATFEQAAVGIALRDIDPRKPCWLRVNQKLCDILGYSSEELLRLTPVDLTPAQDRDAATDFNEQLLRGEIKSLSREKRYVRKDGRIIWANISLSTVGGSDSAPAYIISIIKDITEQKRVEAEVLMLNAELEERVAERTTELVAANQELEAFAYSVSHDLRAPLRALDGFSQILLDEYGGKLDAMGQDYLRRVRAGSQRMAQLIDDLLRLSRITRHELQRETIDLSALARDVASEMRGGSTRAANISIYPGMDVDGDLSLVRVALENVLRNAWKFTQGVMEARIEVGCEALNGETVFFVKDNGAGFDMRYAEKLFGPFQRLHSESEFAGTGIGLAIVQRVVQRHGGRIWAEGAPGAGAMFRFTLTPPEARPPGRSV